MSTMTQQTTYKNLPTTLEPARLQNGHFQGIMSIKQNTSIFMSYGQSLISQIAFGLSTL